MDPSMKQIMEAADFLSRQGVGKPELGVILGTGLGRMVEHMRIEKSFDYAEIPHFPLSTVEFHRGRLLSGSIAGAPALVMQGRFHHYEGYSLQQLAFPVRVMKVLGVKVLLLSNAAGVLNLKMRKGELMMLEDHINFLAGSPLEGPNLDELGPRYPDMREPYSPRLRAHLSRIAAEEGIALHEGVYAAVGGPQFETRAEYRYLRMIGADVVGMSTVPEVITAVHMGMEVAAVSVLTDECDPDHLEPMDVDDILSTAARAEEGLIRLFLALVRQLGD